MLELLTGIYLLLNAFAFAYFVAVKCSVAFMAKMGCANIVGLLPFTFTVEMTSQSLVVCGNYGVISDTTVDARCFLRCRKKLFTTDRYVLKTGHRHQNHQKDWLALARPVLEALPLVEPAALRHL